MSRGLTELESFLQKFPLQWEIILVVDPSSDATLKKAQALKSEKIETRVLENPKHWGRGPSVLRGLQAAEGDCAIVFPLDFTIPLAEIFQFLQEMIHDPQMDLIVGNRNSSRKKREAPRKSHWHWTLENILSEKLRSVPVQDPICPYLAIRKSALMRILPNLKLKSWYYTPEILIQAHQAHLKIGEVPVLSRDPKPSRIPLLREFLRHFF